MGLLDNKNAIVIGASGGIGLACVEEFLIEGANVIGSYRRPNDKISQLKDKYLNKFNTFELDLDKQESIQSTLKSQIKNLGSIDILVNAAGISNPELLHMSKPEHWEETIKINLLSAFHIIQSAIIPMISNGGGSIIQISSLFGIKGGFGQTSYSASKAGLIGMIKSASIELANRNVRLNVIAPGFIETDMTDRMVEKYRKKFLEEIPMHRAGTAKEVAELCTFLASDKSIYITGQTLIIDGGWSVK